MDECGVANGLCFLLLVKPFKELIIISAKHFVVIDFLGLGGYGIC